MRKVSFSSSSLFLPFLPPLLLCVLLFFLQFPSDSLRQGRLVLGDGVAYGIQRFKPDVLLDMCTLTGLSP